MKYIFIFILTAISFKLSPAQGQVLSPRIANYDIEVRLDTAAKMLYADQILVWKNTSKDTIRDLYFHLYYNAFKNSESTFFRERGVPDFLTNDIDKECGWGWSQVISIKDRAGTELIAEAGFVAPDDGNTMDQSVLRVPLKQAILPDSSAVFQMEWEARIPRTMPRTGYNKDFYFFAQWFPKVGVYESAGQRYAKAGQWNCHQYHSSGEYFADFGVYNVSITVPGGFEVAASGALMGQTKKGKEMTWHFVAEDVIDFSWTGSPQFDRIEDSFGDTRIQLYIYPYKAHFAERYLSTIKHCMAYLSERFEPYPYPTLSIIDPPIYGMYTGGMEYPTLITSLSFCFFPKGIRTPETLVVHEYIHQYFMQMVATHEVEDPWMDEGITSYYESRILNDLFGKNASTIDVWGFRAGNAEYNRIEFFGSKNIKIAPNTIKSWEFKHGGYGYISYNKTALWLKTLEGIIGTELMDSIMLRYFKRWQFRHPCRTDFTDVVNEVIVETLPDRFPEGMDWFFDQVLYGTEACDYAVASIENNIVNSDRGFYNNSEDCEVHESVDGVYNSKAIFYRLEEMQLPVQCRVTLEDGSVIEKIWDGQARSFEIQSNGTHRIVSAEIDPDRKIYIDKNFLNNSRTINNQSTLMCTLSMRLLTSFQHFLETLALWV
jgi:hypothetical protein